MSVVKSLALGASILGCLVAPTRAGSIRPSHRIPDRPNPTGFFDAPTSLVVRQPSLNLAVRPAAENLATPGFVPSQTFFSSFNSGSRSSAPLTLATLNQAIASAPQSVAFTPAPAPAASSYASTYAAPAAPAAAPAPTHNVAAFINFGNAPYSEAQSLTTGNPQSWTQSQAVQAVFHGTPTADQQAAFKNEVLQVVQNTYANSGLNLSVTTDPTANYAHTMSVVSGASYAGNSQAIGITDVGNDGFSFIDKFNLAKTPDELATAVGKNVAHELMHAFGVAGHPDQTGTYLDAASANWSTLTNANTTFSPQASQMLASQNFLSGPGKEFTQGALGLSGLELLTQHHPVTCNCPYCNALHKLEAAEGLNVGAASPVPEPTTVALWGIAGVGAVVARRGRGRRGQA